MDLLIQLLNSTSFIVHADFLFPESFEQFIQSIIYSWDYNTGGSNIDALLRAPLRLRLSPFYLIGGQTMFAYSYIAFIFSLTFFTAKKMIPDLLNIDSKDNLYSYILPLIITFNPVFLGNISKVGIQLGVMSSFGALLYSKKYTDKQNKKDLLKMFLYLHFSLIHPFTAIISLVFTAYSFIRSGNVLKWFKDYAFIKYTITFIGLHLFMLLPFLTGGSLSKNQLGSGLDSDSLIETANNDSILEALSFSKSIFLDYNFYNGFYRPIFFISALGFTLLNLLLIRTLYSKLDFKDKKNVNILLVSILTIALLSSVSFIFKDVLQLINNLPGGWAFRSPLKWQLYLPVLVLMLSGVLMKYVNTKKLQALLKRGMIWLWVLSISFVSFDVVSKLINPKSVNTLLSLEQTIKPDNQVLHIHDGPCYSDTFSSQTNSEFHEFNSELNYIYSSSKAQINRINIDELENININDYDIITSCGEILSISQHSLTEKTYHISEVNTYVYSIDSYEPVYIAEDIIESSAKNINFLQDSTEIKNVIFQENNSEDSQYSKELINIFEGVSSSDFIQDKGQIKKSISLNGRTPYRLKADSNLIKYTLNDSGYTFVLDHENYDYINLLENSNFEFGPWRNTLGDCYNYDDSPIISQNVTSDNFLKLSAKNHIACTENVINNISDKDNLYVEFDYKKMNQFSKGLAIIQFNDNQVTTERINLENPSGKISTYVPIPPNSTSARIIIYSASLMQKVETSEVLYGNFYITTVPEEVNQSYLIRDSVSVQNDNNSTSIKHVSPVEWSAKILNQTDDFSIVLKDSFSSNWNLYSLSNTRISSRFITRHIRVNNNYNAWSLKDIESMCNTYKDTCVINQDGSYDIQLTFKYSQQRYVELGFMSGVMITGSLQLAERFKNKKQRKKHA